MIKEKEEQGEKEEEGKHKESGLSFLGSTVVGFDRYRNSAALVHVSTYRDGSMAVCFYMHVYVYLRDDI